MKTNTPAFQFYPQDFLVGTALFSPEETGAYIRLLCYQWNLGGLPDNNEQLARLAGCSGNAVASIRHKFGICQDSKLRNARLEDVRAKQNEFRSRQKEKAENRWKMKKTDAVALPQDQSGICRNDALQSSSSNKDFANAKSIAYETSEAGSEGGPEVNSKVNSEVIPEVIPEVKPKVKSEVNLPLTSKVKPKRTPLPNDEWIADIKRHYPNIDVDAELRKMDAWCETNRRVKTRKFVVNWLNKTLPAVPPKPKDPSDSEYDW